MANRKIMLLEAAPKFAVEGGLFYVDFGIEDMPLFALSPAAMLKAISRARSEYMDFMGAQGNIALSGCG